MTAGAPVATGNNDRAQHLQDLWRYGHTHVHEGCVDHSNSTHLQNKEGVLAGSHLGKQQAQRVSQCDGIFCGE